MTKTINVKVEDLSAKWIEQIKETHKHATLEIKVQEAVDETLMTDAAFWAIIDLLDWKKGKDTAAILAPAIKRLMSFEVALIYKFQDLLATKLYALDQQVFAENIGSRRYGGTKNFSVDVFLYARAAVVANGQKFYELVLKDPTKMPKEFTFEALLSLAPTAFQQKTGQEWDYLPTPSYETYTNSKGWNGKSWMEF